MKLKLILAATAMLAAPALMTANAQVANVYVTGGYTQLGGDAPEVGGVTGRVGVGLGTYFAVEGEGTFGVKDDGPFELDNQIGAFGVAKLPIAPSFDIFGRVGFSQTEINGFDDDGLAYGVGAIYYFTEMDGIRGDITRHDYDSAEVDSFGVSYVRQF
ncbi:MAG: outer membrane beta-barrel protein [Alphaproteobacteria bacterium]|nr:outer membrane beta-barrel protein [Alphaproteobacteria bacterium]